MRTHLVLALGAVALLFGAARADAQFAPNTAAYGPGYRGNISPYLNLLRGQNTGIDYYLGTRSEQQRRANAQQFRDDIDDLDRRDPLADLDQQTRPTPIQSGTPTTFGSTMGYYTRQNYIAPPVGRGGGGIGGPPKAGRRR